MKVVVVTFVKLDLLNSLLMAECGGYADLVCNTNMELKKNEFAHGLLRVWSDD